VGTRAHGLGLFLFALPEALPLPIAGVSAILGIPLIILSAHLLIFGSRRELPGSLLRRKLPGGMMRLALSKAIPILQKIERISRPRWQRWTSMERLLGLVCLILAIVITLPIPFGNLPPAICLAAISFGLLARDGVLVVIGLAGSVVLLGSVGLLADFLVGLFYTERTA